MRNLLGAALAATMLLATPAAAQNLVTNGNFEASTTSLAGWTTSSLNPLFLSSTGVIEGSRSAAANCVGAACIRDTNGTYWTGSNGGGTFLYQDLATVAGQTYTIDFAFNSRGGGGSELAVLFGGSLVEDFVDVATGARSYTRTATASASITRLLFLGRQDPASLRLDSVSVVGPAAVGDVPEPATWGMMILGFGIVGAAARRRRSMVTLAH